MNYLRRRKYLLIFLFVLFFLSILFGIFLFIKQNENIKLNLLSLDNIKESLINNHIFNLFDHLIILGIIVLFSFIIIGYLGGLFYLFYVGMSIGYTLTFLFYLRGINGLLFGIVYNIYSKLLLLLFLILILIKLYDIVKNIIGFILYRKNINLMKNFKYNIKKIFLLVLLLLLNDIIIYFTSKFVLKIIITML